MTDTQLLIGIVQNDNRVWRYICRNYRPGFFSILGQAFLFGPSATADIEDIFQESLMVLMKKVKSNEITITRDGALFGYLVQIGKLKACNFIRKKYGSKQKEEESPNIIPFLAIRGTKIPDILKEQEGAPGNISISEKQQTQNEFLDRAFDSLPDTCKTIFKKFYWERKPFDEIADIIGFGSEDSVKTKKSKCMKKFVDFAKKLLADDEFAEDAVRDTVERAALRELINEERVYAETGVTQAALDLDEDSDIDIE